MRELSYEEMKALAIESFGEDARVLKETLAEDGSWIVYSGIKERFDPEKYKDTPAYTLYNTPAKGYRDALEEWYADEYGSYRLDAVSVEHEFLIYNEWYEKDMARRTQMFEKSLDRLGQTEREIYITMVDHMVEFAVEQGLFPRSEMDRFRNKFLSERQTDTPNNS